MRTSSDVKLVRAAYLYGIVFCQRCVGLQSLGTSMIIEYRYVLPGTTALCVLPVKVFDCTVFFCFRKVAFLDLLPWFNRLVWPFSVFILYEHLNEVRRKVCWFISHKIIMMLFLVLQPFPSVLQRPFFPWFPIRFYFARHSSDTHH